MSVRRPGEWQLWNASGPIERAQDAIALLASGIDFGPFPLDHVGFCEARSDVERLTETLGLPHETFDSIVLSRELSVDLRITRLRVQPGRHLELFWFANGLPPTSALIERSHLAFRVPEAATVERMAARFGTPVREARDGALLTYLLPWLELIASSGFSVGRVAQPHSQ